MNAHCKTDIKVTLWITKALFLLQVIDYPQFLIMFYPALGFARIFPKNGTSSEYCPCGLIQIQGQMQMI